MNKITKYPFSQLYDMASGISSTKEQAGHGSPFVSFSTVFNNYFLPDTLPDLMDTSAQEQETYSIKEGDILITRTSETIDELAMSCVATKDYPRATYSGFTKRLRPKTEGIAYHKYLAFYLRGKLFRKTVTNNAFMTLRASFNEDIFSFLHLYLPEYEEQVKIGNLLYAIEQKMQLNKRVCTELEAMAKTLYDYWFTQFDFPNAEGKPYRSSGGEMVWNDQLKRDIPKGWSCSVIANHIGASKGGDWGKEAPEGNYKNEVVCIRGADFPSINGSKPLNAPVRYILSKNVDKILSSGDIVVEISGGSPTQSTGRICYINDYTLKRFDKDIITSNFCKAFSTKKAPEQYWLYLLWKTLYDAGVLFGFEGKTTGIKNLLFDDFCAQYHIVAPDETVLQKFHEVVSPIFDKIQQYNIENDELTKLRDWLLPMLMNGQATVTDEKQVEVIPFKNHQVEVKQAARDFNGKQHSDDTEALVKEFMRRKGNDKGT